MLHGSLIFASYVVLLSCGNHLSCISSRYFFLLTWATTENRSCLKLSMATVHCFWCLYVNWPVSFPSTLPFGVLPGYICCCWPFFFLVSCLYVAVIMPSCWWMLHQKVYKLNTVEHCCIPVANYSTYVVSWKLLYTSVILSSCKVKSWVKCPWINAWKRAWICFISYGNTLNTFDAVDTRTEGNLKQKFHCLPQLCSFSWSAHSLNALDVILRTLFCFWIDRCYRTLARTS